MKRLKDEDKDKILKILNEIDEEDKVDIEEQIAESIALVEYYYKVRIDGHYPIMKRINQQDYLMKAFELDAKRFGLKTDG